MAFQYEHAPITEAIIDIRVESPTGIDLETLEALHDQVANVYPGRNKRTFVLGEFLAGDTVSASARQTQTGFAFISGDGKQIFQARIDGFSFSRLRPYGNWADLRDEAKRLWTIYSEATKHVTISRVAVRYINQIDIPSAEVDYKEYFRTTPEVSPVLPQLLSDFFMVLHFPQADFGGMLVLREAAVPPPRPGMTSVIIDLDVFKYIRDVTSADDVWALLETLRVRKNEFFEGSLTDKARELFGDRREY